MTPHIEGGFFSPLFEDPGIIPHSSLPNVYKGDRPYWNGIMFLIPSDGKSCFHRILMNESWHFYLGDPLDFYEITESGEFNKYTLGQDLLKGEKVMHTVIKNHWMGAKPQTGKYGFSLVGCITAPGFKIMDWEKGEKEKLLNFCTNIKAKKIILELAD